MNPAQTHTTHATTVYADKEKSFSLTFWFKLWSWSHSPNNATHRSLSLSLCFARYLIKLHHIPDSREHFLQVRLNARCGFERALRRHTNTHTVHMCVWCVLRHLNSIWRRRHVYFSSRHTHADTFIFRFIVVPSRWNILRENCSIINKCDDGAQFVAMTAAEQHSSPVLIEYCDLVWAFRFIMKWVYLRFGFTISSGVSDGEEMQRERESDERRKGGWSAGVRHQHADEDDCQRRRVYAESWHGWCVLSLAYPAWLSPHVRAT